MLYSTFLFGVQSPIDIEELPHFLNVTLFVVSAIIVATAMTVATRVAITMALQWLARRSRNGSANLWTLRVPRLGHETDDVAVLRREQRVKAAGAMLGRVAGVLIWVVVLFLVLAGLEVDLAWALSSAGFIGAGLAIGGQNTVHDYLNGVHILLEDRFGEGDEIEVVGPSGLTIRGTVERIGTFSTRLRGEDTTWHLANRLLPEVSNLSQRGQRLDLDIAIDAPLKGDVEMALQRALVGAGATENARLPVVIDQVRETRDTLPGYGYHIRARVPFTVEEDQQLAIQQELANLLKIAEASESTKVVIKA